MEYIKYIFIGGVAILYLNYGAYVHQPPTEDWWFRHNPYNQKGCDIFVMRVQPQLNASSASQDDDGDKSDLGWYPLESSVQDLNQELMKAKTNEEKARIHKAFGKKGKSPDPLYHLCQMLELAETQKTYEDACIELGNTFCGLESNFQGICYYMLVQSPAGIQRIKLAFNNIKKRNIFNALFEDVNQSLLQDLWFSSLDEREQEEVEKKVLSFRDWLFQSWPELKTANIQEHAGEAKSHRHLSTSAINGSCDDACTRLDEVSFAASSPSKADSRDLPGSTRVLERSELLKITGHYHRSNHQNMKPLMAFANNLDEDPDLRAEASITIGYDRSWTDGGEKCFTTALALARKNDTKAKAYLGLGRARVDSIKNFTEAQKLATSKAVFEGACIGLGNALSDNQKNFAGIVEYMKLSSSWSKNKIRRMYQTSGKKRRVLQIILCKNWQTRMKIEFGLTDKDEEEKRQAVQYVEVVRAFINLYGSDIWPESAKAATD